MRKLRHFMSAFPGMASVSVKSSKRFGKRYSPKRTRFKKEGVKRLSWLPQSAEAASGTLALPARSARGCR